jgi:predicted ATPase
MLSKPTPRRPDFERRLKKAAERVKAMSTAELKEMLREQSESWARGEKAMGTDADEAAYRDALAQQQDQGGER